MSLSSTGGLAETATGALPTENCGITIMVRAADLQGNPGEIVYSHNFTHLRHYIPDRPSVFYLTKRYLVMRRKSIEIIYSPEGYLVACHAYGGRFLAITWLQS